MIDDTLFLEFCFKYPELICSFYKNKRWYLKQLNLNQISGDITLDELKLKIDNGYKPIISLVRLSYAIEYYKCDKIIFNKYENLITDWNNIYAE